MQGVVHDKEKLKNLMENDLGEKLSFWDRSTLKNMKIMTKL